MESQWLLHMLENGIIAEEKGAPVETVRQQLKVLVDNFDIEGAQKVKDI